MKNYLLEQNSFPFDILPFCPLIAEIIKPDGQTKHKILAFNEIFIERINLYVANYSVYIDDQFLAKICSDGLIISTQIGSTAYCYSAQGSIVYPNSSIIQLTPTNPFGINFRSMVLPNTV